MANDLADRIRERLDVFDEDHGTWDCGPGQCIHDAVKAVRAVVAKCEQLRAEAPVGRFIAAEFEQTVAHALGVGDG